MSRLSLIGQYQILFISSKIVIRYIFVIKRSASDFTLHRIRNLTQNELELGNFNLIFQ